MTEVGVYKPFKSILFKDEKNEDTSGWSPEIIGLIKIIERYSSSRVTIWSETDAEQYYPEGDRNIDLLFVFNGKFDDEDYRFIESCRDAFKILCVSDLDLLPRNDVLLAFDAILSQSTRCRATRSRKERYYPFQSLVCVDAPVEEKTKEFDYVFLGNERSRLAKLMEYCWRPGCLYFGKAPSLGFNRKVSFREAQRVLGASRHSIVFADPSYEKTNFITQRYYECLINDVVPFIDRQYDAAGDVIQQRDYRRVSSFYDVYKKMEELRVHQVVFDNILNEQRRQWMKYRTGEVHFKRLVDILKEVGGPSL